MDTVRIICRDSMLSLLQANLVREKIEEKLPGTIVEIIPRLSRGDRENCVSLATLDGTDFFTEEIFEALYKGEADIAVHSLKDMSAEHFFSHDAFAIVDRDDPRDVAIFNQDTENKISKGKTLIIGTCSPRREEMATIFLKKALPQIGPVQIETRPIRGNVESRLQQLHLHKFDGTILAAAGLNRLLRSTEVSLIRELLKGKRFMFLPLVECVPAPCQGAIVAEAHPHNHKMIAILKKIDRAELHEEAINEKNEGAKYGRGSMQPFGVTTIHTAQGNKVLYAAGKNENGHSFSKWSGLPELESDGKKIFSSTDHMGGFFDYTFVKHSNPFNQPVIFVSNYKAVQQNEVLEAIHHKRVWASGTKTWIELAKKGIWVEGCADSMGLECLKVAMAQPIINISSADIHILTHSAAAKHWSEKGWNATSTYTTRKKDNPILKNEIRNADFIFWTSIHQYLQYKDEINENVAHLAPSGETAALLKLHGIEPILFPTIKAFEQWRKSSIRPLSVA